MNNLKPQRVSVLDPIDDAIGRVKLVLFQPFDLGKWFAIGFCAWLAYLGQGGANFHFGGGIDDSGAPSGSFDDFKTQVVENLHWIIPVAIFVTLFIIIISLLIIWLSSRGRFMFLHSVVSNSSQVKVPWTHFAQRANSMFVFRFVLGIISFLVMLPFIGGIVFCAYLLAEEISLVVPIICLVGLILLIITIGIIIGIILKFTEDFITPIMYKHNLLCIDAWRYFLPLAKANKGRLILYLLFQIVISIAIGAIVIGACCLTGCCLGIIFAIPYIGTVALLPILVFDRAYSIFYLRQFGPDFDVFNITQVVPVESLPEVNNPTTEYGI